MSVYTEKELNSTCIDEAVSLLNKVKYLTESESTYHAEMVPIKENTRLGKKMIRLEDFVDYASSNGTTNANKALQEIAAASNINTSDIAFSVDEVSVLEDLNMEETVRQLISAGANVYTIPVSESNSAYVVAEACFKAMTKSEDPISLFEAYVNDDFESYFSDGNVQHYLEKNIKFNESNIEAIIDESVDDPIKWLAEQISSLRHIDKKYLNESGDMSALIKRGISYLESVRKENI